MFVDGSARNLDEVADFVIVGSGAAGATCARLLSQAGRSVIVVEEGTRPLAQAGEDAEAYAALYRDAATTRAVGRDLLLLLQGRAVGGSTVVAGGVHEPMPEQVWHQWVQRDRLWEERLPWSELQWARGRIDADLAVTKTPTVLWGDVGTSMFRGLPGHATPAFRSASGCRGSGRCWLGCPHGGKASADVALLPVAIHNKAMVVSRCKIERIILDGVTARGVSGTFDSGKLFTARARVAVLLAAGAIGSTHLLLRAGVRGIGQKFQSHPIATLSSLMPNSAATGPQATEAMLSVAFRDQGFWLGTQRLPSVLRTSHIAGSGQALASRLAQMPHVVQWCVHVRAQARGTIVDNRGAPQVHYTPDASDRARAMLGLAVAAEGMLTAGALEVWPNVFGAPEVITSVKQARAMANLKIGPAAISWLATDFFGGIPVDSWFQVLGLERVVLADSSMFPTNLGVPPLSTMHAVASLVAQRWVEARPLP